MAHLWPSLITLSPPPSSPPLPHHHPLPTTITLSPPSSPVPLPSPMPTAISKDSFSRPARRQYCYRSTSTTSSPKSVSFASPPSLQTATTPRLPAPPQTLDDAVAHVFNTLYPLHANPSPTRAPIIIRDVSPKVWELFRRKHADHSAFKSSKFEYDDSRMKIIAYPLAKPLHDFANKVMTKHIYLGMSAARLDSQKRVGSLLIDRESKLTLAIER